jgi:hypothetical protein
MVRHDAGIAPVERGERDPVVALSLVVWPRKGSRLEDVPLGKQFYSDDFREEIRARPAADETLRDWPRRQASPSTSPKKPSGRQRGRRNG